MYVRGLAVPSARCAASGKATVPKAIAVTPSTLLSPIGQDRYTNVMPAAVSHVNISCTRPQTTRLASRAAQIRPQPLELRL